jgi:hypothetical protein
MKHLHKLWVDSLQRSGWLGGELFKGTKIENLAFQVAYREIDSRRRPTLMQELLLV